MDVSGELHTPVVLSSGGESPYTNWIGGWVDPRAGLDAVAKRKNPTIAPVGNRTPIVQHIA